jgi:predicted short-subunit dehydrogenase-like oxidoreductase (DUF2520 family)
LENQKGINKILGTIDSMTLEDRKIFIFGTGNMSWALAKSFLDAGVRVAGIYGRNASDAEELSQKLNITHCENIHVASQLGDIVILTVKDDALSLLDTSLRLPGRIVLHTSGSVGMDSISHISEYIGVFYPMERVIKFKDPDLISVPLCIEANSSALLTEINSLASKLSTQVYSITSEQRKKLHLAAVFVSNFTTYMLSVGSDLVKKYGLPENILDSLVATTLEGLTTQNAIERQTGPAKRGDIKVVWDHIHQLENDQPELAEIYKLISLRILKRYNLDSKL